jgi:hypothetical protein
MYDSVTSWYGCRMHSNRLFRPNFVGHHKINIQTERLHCFSSQVKPATTQLIRQKGEFSWL